MKRLTWALILLVFLSCRKSNDPEDMRLRSIEFTDYSNNVSTTEYSYDNLNRITSIIKKAQNEQPVVLVTISYNGNEAILLSSPDIDPSLIQNTEVRFTLDATGKPLKRIEFTKRISKNAPTNPFQEFRNDTMKYEYDAAGLLKKTTRNRRDSLWSQPAYTMIRQFTSTATYTNTDGNLVSSDEYFTYPYVTTQGGVTTISGGSSESKQVYHYSKAFPNQTDFKNAFVLNEYRSYYEPVLNSNYKNMHDQVEVNNTDWDINGTIIFNGKGTINMDRMYDKKGLLSSVTIPAGSTQYTKILYFYERK